MKKTKRFLASMLFSALFVQVGMSIEPQGCVQTLNVSTGYDQVNAMLIPDGAQDDDWILTQKPSSVAATLGQPGYIFTKYWHYDWAGSTSKWMNYHPSNEGPNNWCANELPYVYQNPFCVCGEGEEVEVTFDLNLHCDNWAEVWLMDASGNTMQLLLSQIHQEVPSNFKNPTDHVNTSIMLAPGSYSLALVQRNKNSVTGVTLDGTISVQEGEGVMNGNECEFVPTLANIMDGPEDKCDGSGGGGTGNGCPEYLNMSTGYDEVSGALIADNQSDDDWVLTQLPSGASGTVGLPGYVIPKDVAYDWAGTTSKYLNSHNGTSGIDNWYNNDLPIVYQNGFCLCGPIEEDVEVTFDLSLHGDNWAEVWLMDDAGNPIQLLLTQSHVVTTANFTNPADQNNVTVVLQPGQYSLALLQRNEGQTITGVSLNADVYAVPYGLLDGDICNYEPTLNEPFQGSEVTNEGHEHKPGFKKGNGSGQSQIENTEIRIFPNPANELVEISGIPVGRKIVITSIDGKRVLSQKYKKSNGIDISAVSPGVYFLKVELSETEEFIEKLVIE